MNEQRLMPEMELNDGQFVARTFRASDAPKMYEAACESIAEIYRWLPWCHPDYEIGEAEAWIAARPAAWVKREELSFAVLDAATRQFLGGCGLNQFHPTHRMANLGYWIRTSAAGRGAASAATLLVARFGFRVLGLQRIEILADVDNYASQRVAEKAGAQREGRLRNRLFHHQHIRDGVMFSLTPADVA
jgi:RimJ/RimL family protein N-acetyltransferase